jgi:LCP family protein required for cell wall assembly
MDCREARRLLDAGITPGSQSPERATLGFHLAGCEACRSYRSEREAVLLDRLLNTPAAPVFAPKSVQAPAVSGVSALGRRERLARALWMIGIAVLGTLLLAVAIVVGSIVRSLFVSHDNVQAMIVPTIAESPTALAPTAGLVQPPPPLDLLVTPTPEITAAPSATPTPRATATPRPTATPNAPPPGGPATILLMGSDRRPDEREPSRTDALMVMRVDPERRRIALLSLPRDLMVQVPGYGWSRINAANVLGNNGAEGGRELARKTVSNLLGVPIDYYVYIDFQGFIGAIDALGGVTVNVDKELYDAKFPTMDYGYTVAHFLPGPQRMDGETALTYSRVRHPDSDFARMRRQQAVVVGVLGQLRDDNVLGQLQRLEQVSTALRGYVKTDMPELRIIGLAWALRDFAPAQVERYSVEASAVTFGFGNDVWAERIAPEAIAELTDKLMGR